MQTYESNLSQLFAEGNDLDKMILENLKGLKYE
jgi:type I restriction enzyme M protein